MLPSTAQNAELSKKPGFFSISPEIARERVLPRFDSLPRRPICLLANEQFFSFYDQSFSAKAQLQT
jgi:hypothetical protein